MLRKDRRWHRQGAGRRRRLRRRQLASSQEGAEKVVAEITGKGGKAIAVGGDVSKAADVKSLFDATQKAFGRFDILVNNAGVYKFAPIEEVTEADYRWHFDINVLGPLLTIKEALKHFPAQGGSIINVSSVAAFSPTPLPPFTPAPRARSTRSASCSRTNSGAQDPSQLTQSGRHRNGRRTPDRGDRQRVRKDIVRRTPLARMGQPDDIAKVAVFLASDDSAWVTGERITASGGLR